MSLEAIMFIAISAAFIVGVLLGNAGKRDLRKTVQKLTEKLGAVNVAYDEQMRRANRNGSEVQRLTNELEHVRSKVDYADRLIVRVRAFLKESGAVLTEPYGTIEADDRDYKIEIKRTLLPEADRPKPRQATVFMPERLQQPKPRPVMGHSHQQRQRAEAARTTSRVHHAHSEPDTLAQSIVHATVLNTVLSSEPTHSAPEPVRCDPTPSYDSGSNYDSGGCSSPSFD